MKGLILVDVAAHDLRCGEYVDLPDDVGEQLALDGRFDPNAPDPDVQDLSAAKSRRARK